MSRSYAFLFSFFLLSLVIPFSGCASKWELLEPEERQVVDRILSHWETWVPDRKKAGTAPLITFDELYEGLRGEEIWFLNQVRDINPKRHFDFQGKFFGITETPPQLKRIEGQVIQKSSGAETLNPQYLPENVYQAYQVMMDAMQKDLGKKLLIESGYRSPAYQLYIFLFYLPKHGYSVVETGHWVALPGYSEHGAPERQAIDFINQKGINGEDNVEEFERLPEYQWLLANAGAFGFELSYPRDQKGITFEPWHWRYLG